MKSMSKSQNSSPSNNSWDTTTPEGSEVFQHNDSPPDLQIKGKGVRNTTTSRTHHGPTPASPDALLGKEAERAEDATNSNGPRAHRATLDAALSQSRTAHPPLIGHPRQES